MPADGPVDTTADPAQILDSLATLSEREVEKLMEGSTGRAVLDEIFRQMRDNFRPGSAKGEDALVRFVITGPRNTPDDVYELRIHDGECMLGTEATAAAQASKALSITTDRVRFVRVITGQANGAKLYLQRKIKIDGDLKFGGRVIGWFNPPKAK